MAYHENNDDDEEHEDELLLLNEELDPDVVLRLERAVGKQPGLELAGGVEHHVEIARMFDADVGKRQGAEQE